MKKLTLKQEKFIDAYIETRDYHEAYSLAFDCSKMRPSSITTEGWRLLRNPTVAQEIARRLEVIGEAADEKMGFDAVQALQMFLDIARADPNELIGLRVGACRHCWGVMHEYQWRTESEWEEAVSKAEKAGQPLPEMTGGFDYDHTRAPNSDCPYCRGEGRSRVVPQDTRKLSPGGRLLYQGVKHTKEGPVVLLADKTKALENAAKIVGAFVERLDLSGSVSVAKPDLTGLTATDAAATYAAFVAGVDKKGK